MEFDDFSDIFFPAQQQFGGAGSYGNGAASRIAPVSLYFHKDVERMLEVTQKATLLSHTNDIAVNGALLQSMAVRNCLQVAKEDGIDSDKFVNDLLDRMKVFEKAEDVERFTILSPMRPKHVLQLAR